MTRKLTIALLATASVTCLFAMRENGPIVNPDKDVSVTDGLTVTPFMDIASAGPLTHVYIGNELSCQVAHISDGATREFYPPGTIPGDCGTFVAVAGTLYAPDFASHGMTATNGLGSRVVFTPISQTAVTGAGTTANPFKVITVVGVGATGLRIQQTDTYVIGDEAYKTEVVISNNGGPSSGVLYRAGDAFLAGSDFGYGFTEAFGDSKAVACSVNANNAPPSKIEEWVPQTGGNNFYQSLYSSVWTWIGTKAPFPNTCGCATRQDNGAGISWNFSISAGGSVTFSHVTTFSPLGRQALVTSKVADSEASVTGSQNGYTIRIENRNSEPVTVTSITDTLPAGFTSISGSTTGVTTSNPAVNGQVLTWSGQFVVAPNSSISLHFAVIVASVAGDYFNQAGGVAASGYTVTGSGPTARITVGSDATPIEITIDNPPSDHIFRIGPEPSVPQIPARAKITGITPDPTATTTFTWIMSVHYNASQSPHGPGRVFDHSWPVTTTTGNALLQTNFSDVRGGDLTLTAKAVVNGVERVSAPLAGYKILGPPSGGAVDLQVIQQLHTILTNSTLRKIAANESGGHQFDANGYPLWSQDGRGGVGIMQITNPEPTIDRVWSWRANVGYGKQLFREKVKNAQDLRGIIQDKVYKYVNAYRLKQHPPPQPPPRIITIVVPPLTSHGTNLFTFDQEFDGVTFSDSIDQLEQDAIRCYNGVGPTGIDVFGQQTRLHEFRIRRTQTIPPRPVFLESDETIEATGRATVQWEHASPRINYFPAGQCPSTCDYVHLVLSAADLPH